VPKSLGKLDILTYVAPQPAETNSSDAAQRLRIIAVAFDVDCVVGVIGIALCAAFTRVWVRNKPPYCSTELVISVVQVHPRTIQLGE
jgi:hypothetical protein